MHIFNTLGRERMAFEPREPGTIGMYVCGATVQTRPHLGHGRYAVVFDVVRRYFEWLGYDVTYVRNITDVEDKIIAAAAERGVDTSVVVDEALQAVRGSCEMAALTRSDKGSVILENGTAHIVDAEPVDRLVDTTGAGDLYAAGFLCGYTQGKAPYDCGRMGAIAAAEIISHYGARPEKDLKALIADV